MKLEQRIRDELRHEARQLEVPTRPALSDLERRRSPLGLLAAAAVVGLVVLVAVALTQSGMGGSFPQIGPVGEERVAGAGDLDLEFGPDNEQVYATGEVDEVRWIAAASDDPCLGMRLQGSGIDESGARCEMGPPSALEVAAVGKRGVDVVGVYGWVSDEVDRVVWEAPPTGALELKLIRVEGVPHRVFAHATAVSSDAVTFVTAYDAEGRRLESSGVVGAPGEPAQRSPDSTSSDATDGEATLTRDGWTLVDTPSVFGGTGAQVVRAGVSTEDGVVLVGIDAANGPGERTRPGVWRSAEPVRWQRLDGAAIEIPDAWDEAGVLMTDVAVRGALSGDAAGEDDPFEGQLFAVGYANFEPDTRPAAWLSANGGRTWQHVDLELGAGAAELTGAVWTGERFVLVGRSDDGAASWIPSSSISWLEQPSPDPEGSFHEVVFHDGRLFAISTVGDSSRLWVADAEGSLAWGPVDLPVVGTLSALASDGERLYAVGAIRPDGIDHEGVLLVSADGASWHVDPRSSGLQGPADQLPSDVSIVDDDLIVVGGMGQSAAIWVSESDGPLTVLDDALFPEGSHAATVLTAGDRILVVGSVDRPGGPDVLIWQRPR